MTNDMTSQESTRRRGVTGWLGLIVSVPVRLLGVILIVAFVPGVLMMWRACSLAGRDNLELAVVALEAVHPERSAQPFLPLGYPSLVQKHLIDMRPEQNDLVSLLTLYTVKVRVESCTTTPREGGGYKHVIQFSNGTSRVLESSTPHLQDVSAEEIGRARQAIDQLFPDSKQRALLLEWGKSLFVSEWLSRHRLTDVPRATVPAPFEGTEDEHCFIAWEVLRGDFELDELARLPQLVETAFADKDERDRAVAWARGFFVNVEASFNDFQQVVQARDKNDQKRQRTPSAKNKERTILASLRVTPPDSEWTRAWLLDRYVGLTDVSRKAARSHWLSLFPPGEEATLVTLGETFVKQRQEKDEPLPAVPAVLPLLCVVERLTGTDGHGQRCLTILQQVAGTDPTQRDFLGFAFFSGYPNDEMFFLSASDDTLHLYPFGLSDSPLERKSERLLGQIILILLAALGVATLLDWIVVRFLLRNEARTLWEKHRHGRGQTKVWLTIASIVFFGLLGSLAAPWTLPPVIEVQMASFGELLVASLAATAVGGVLIGTFRRILAVLLVLCRVDIEENWLDEVLGVLLGGFVLFHFGNGFLTILLFALTDIIPEVAKMIQERGWQLRARSASEVAS